MARHTVNVSESVRPWREQGVHFALRDHPDTEWPEPWSVFWSKCSPGCHAVWTYRFLGDDLLGKGDGSRRNSLKECIQAASWPKGSISFWPCMVSPSKSDYEAPSQTDLYMFLSGLRVLVPSVLCIFEDQKSFPPSFLDAIYGLFPPASVIFLPPLEQEDATSTQTRHQTIQSFPSPRG